MVNLAALAHRPESEDSFLFDATHLRVRLHTAPKDVAAVTVWFGDPYWQIPDPKTGAPQFVPQKRAMTSLGVGEATEYWGVTLTAPFRRLQYGFEVIGNDGTRVWFGDRGLRDATPAVLADSNNYFKLPFFHEVDRVRVPAWVKETVWYQIFPERFANGDTTNDPPHTKPWQPADHPGVGDFYGGDLQGVLDHLDDLAALGINGLYLTPIFTAPSNHKYDTIDYLAVDPAFGDKALVARLIEAAHARGMRVMFDAVFNHLGEHSLQWQDVLKNGAASRFADWFHIDHYPLTPFNNPIETGETPPYATFGFWPQMPKLNTANPAVQDYLIGVATYWITQFDIDAWRLDVANEVDHQFWRRFAAAVRAAKPDVYVLGEAWHSAQPWLNGGEFDGVMNYPTTAVIAELFLTGTVDAQTGVARLVDQLMKYRDQTNAAMLNMLDSHDTERLLTLAGGNRDRALQALAFLMLQPGAPCIYYGTEMAMTGGPDPDDRKPMDWAGLRQPYWQALSALIHLRREHAATLSVGRIDFAVADSGLIRVTRTGPDTVVGWFNPTDAAVAWPQTPVALAQGVDGAQLAAHGYAIQVLATDEGSEGEANEADV